MILKKLKSLWARPWMKRSLITLFFALVAGLLIRQGRRIEWASVGESIRAYQTETILIALGFSALSYLLYSCFELLGRHYVGARQHAGRFMLNAFIAYAFTQSLGSFVGTVAFRLRLYGGTGLNGTQISKLIGLSVVTNWFGYTVIAGALFLFMQLPLPPKLGISRDALRIVGAVLLTVGAGYLLLCAFSKKREFKFFGRTFDIPGVRFAIVQLLLSCAHWPATAAVIYILLGREIDFPTVMAGLLLTAVAAVLTHIPAALGVLEMVFVGLLSGRIPAAQVLAALLVYRAVFHLVPLAVAALAYLVTEVGGRQSHGQLSRANR